VRQLQLLTNLEELIGRHVVQPRKIGGGQSLPLCGDAGERVAALHDMYGVVSRVLRIELPKRRPLLLASPRAF
jgi:hypothetical protein